ncbi:DNA polymerase III subunit delta [Desulfuromonas carbonis]|uniref:DNA polymerase III subunit delta n=1 Tax=Desulfuromonas sp. DDH964 TaxID=1823759 RepID=UPI00078E892C|nr:DNA polymerase III subunit delta [Desulfuromonas sp. DDH964]AMV72014.1 DNA polymerase III subunit delta [Desulfuromonas sp. DDH964]
MTPAELHRALADHKVPPLLCLHGEEGFLVEQAWRQILAELVPADARDFNFQQFQGKEARAAAVLDAVQTLPVFAPRRLVLIKNAQDLPTAEQDGLLEYLRNPLPESVLLLVCDKIDARRKLFQAFKKVGALVEFKRLYDNQIPAFIRERLRISGKLMTEDALALFNRRVGNNLQEVVGELEKLFAYLGERDLADVADVAAVVSDSRVDSIFELTNALGNGESGEALRLLGRLLADGQAPLLVLNLIVRHFRQLWLTRELIDQGGKTSDVARRVGVNPYFVDGLIRQARRFSAGRFRRAFDLFLEADLALKSSGAHPAPLLERLILQIAVIK